jgi:hypothetical protein
LRKSPFLKIILAVPKLPRYYSIQLSPMKGSILPLWKVYHYTPARLPHPLSATIPRVKNRGTMWLYTPTRKP